MSLFGNLTNDGLEKTEDRIGGFAPLETNIYETTIKAAYAGKSSGGADSVTLILEADGREYTETIYVSNKKGENFFLNKNDKTKKIGLPGFTVAEHICMVSCEKLLSQMEGEEKVVNVWDNDQKKQVPKSVPMMTELLGKKVYLGIVQQLENKNEKQGDEYVPTAEVRTTNFIDKVFHHPSKLTVPEAEAGATEPDFFDKWKTRNEGQTRDKRSIKDGDAGQSGRPGGNKGAPAAGASSAPKKSLFVN